MPVATMGPTVSGQALRTLVDRIVSNIEDLHDSEIYVLGESLGCVVASQVANRLNAVGKPPAGVILASPPLVLKPLTLLRWSVSPLRRPRSTFKDGVDIEEALEEMIGDPVLASQIIEDPAVARHVSMRYVFDAVISLVGMAISDIRRIHAPLLTLIGENDPLVSQASLALVACLAPSEDNTGLVIERARHSLFWDPETAKVCEVIRDWMYRRDTGNGK
jgi:alpha-beta hydrolase superfamily lysophospholipase